MIIFHKNTRNERLKNYLFNAYYQFSFASVENKNKIFNLLRDKNTKSNILEEIGFKHAYFLLKIKYRKRSLYSLSFGESIFKLPQNLQVLGIYKNGTLKYLENESFLNHVVIDFKFSRRR